MADSRAAVKILTEAMDQVVRAVNDQWRPMFLTLNTASAQMGREIAGLGEALRHVDHPEAVTLMEGILRAAAQNPDFALGDAARHRPDDPEW